MQLDGCHFPTFYCSNYTPLLLQSIALDPRYGTRKTREFFAGGQAGLLLLNSRVNCLVLPNA